MSERIVIKEICEVYDGPHATPKKTVDGPVYLGIDAITDDGKINAKAYTLWQRVDPKGKKFKEMQSMAEDSRVARQSCIIQ